MKIFNKNKLLDTLVIMSLTYLVSWLIIDNLSDFISFAPGNSEDYELSDFYTKVASRQTIDNLNDQICIVSTDSCSRRQLPMLIDAISYCDPAVIGVDIIFQHPAEGDEELIAALNNCPEIVMPRRLVGNPDSSDDMEVYGSCFDSLLNTASFGAVNFPVSDSGYIRRFKPMFISGQDTVLSFSAAIAKIVYPDKFNLLLKRNNSEEDLPYRNISFINLDAFDIIDHDGSFNPEVEALLKNKIVLLSDTENPFDLHNTPTGKKMPGIEIHVRILDTILGEHYVKHTPPLIEYLITFIFSLIFSFLIVTQKHSEKYDNIWSLILRILQLVVIYLLLVVGCKLYINSGRYYNFSTLLIIMADSMLIADIWFGIKELVKPKNINFLKRPERIKSNNSQ